MAFQGHKGRLFRLDIAAPAILNSGLYVIVDQPPGDAAEEVKRLDMTGQEAVAALAGKSGYIRSATMAEAVTE